MFKTLSLPQIIRVQQFVGFRLYGYCFVVLHVTGFRIIFKYEPVVSNQIIIIIINQNNDDRVYGYSIIPTYARLVLLKSEFNNGWASQPVIMDLARGLFDFLIDFFATRPIVFLMCVYYCIRLLGVHIITRKTIVTITPNG